MALTVHTIYGTSHQQSYQFPYRIGIVRNGWTGPWLPTMNTLCTNLSSEADIFAVSHKLQRFGQQIRAQNFPIECIHVAFAQDDMMDVYMNEENGDDYRAWKEFERLIKTTFGISVVN